MRELISYELRLFEPADTGSCCSNTLINFFHSRTYAERKTFVWIIYPEDRWKIRKVLDAENKHFVQDDNNNFDRLLGRPIFYFPFIQPGWILFREYV